MSRTREVLGSILSVAAGVLACCLAWGVGIFLSEVCKGKIVNAVQVGFIYAFYVLVIGGALALATWVVAFVWIYLFVPRNSKLWIWPLCMLCGGIAGGIITSIIVAVLWMENPESLLAFGASGVLVGTVTCLFASLTAPFFKRL